MSESSFDKNITYQNGAWGLENKVKRMKMQVKRTKQNHRKVVPGGNSNEYGYHLHLIFQTLLYCDTTVWRRQKTALTW